MLHESVSTPEAGSTQTVDLAVRNIVADIVQQSGASRSSGRKDG